MSAPPVAVDAATSWVSRRTRAWLGAAIVVLVVATYLAAWLTYDQLHLPPNRYRQLPPGASATHDGASFTLVRLRQTLAFGKDFDGPAAPDPDAVWVVADLTVTRQQAGPYFSCPLYLVTADRRRWESGPGYVSHEGEGCPDDDAALGRTYPIVAYFEVPAADVDQLVGVAVESFTGAPDSLLTPSG